MNTQRGGIAAPQPAPNRAVSSYQPFPADVRWIRLWLLAQVPA